MVDTYPFPGRAFLGDGAGGSGATTVAPAGAQGGGSLSVNQEGLRNTYSASAVGLVPAASATDIFSISGSTGTIIRINRISISGTAGTLVTLPVTLVKRVSLNTGGTAGTGAAAPVAAKHYTGNATSLATLTSYTANPTIVDSSPTYYRSRTLTMPVTTAGTSSSIAEWVFGQNGGQPLILGLTASLFALNLNGISVSSGVVNVDIEWTEVLGTITS